MQIIASSISKTFGKKTALDNLNFCLKSGQITGLLGPNGGGKTTLMRILCGLTQASNGEFSFQENYNRITHTEIKATIGYLPENNPLNLHLYVKEFLNLKGAFFGKTKKDIQILIEKVGLSSHQNHLIGALSKGYKQRVGIANAIIHDPKIIILDEPTTGLDPNQIKDIRNLIQTLGKDKIVLFSSHLLFEVEAICQEILLLHKGKLLLKGDIKNLKNKASLQLEVFLSSPLEDVWDVKLIQKYKGHKIGTTQWIFSKNIAELKESLLLLSYEKKINILELKEKQSSLESIFTDITTAK